MYDVVKNLEEMINYVGDPQSNEAVPIFHIKQSFLKEVLDLIREQQAQIDKLSTINKYMDEFARSISRLRTSEGKPVADSETLIAYVQEKECEALKNFAVKLKCGVPQDTGVIRCKDVDFCLGERLRESLCRNGYCKIL